MNACPSRVVFSRYIGVDYSGARTPVSGLKGLRAYMVERDASPAEVSPPPGPRKYWTRRGLAEWLADRLAEDSPALVGIDHGFSFPRQYFEAHRLPLDWLSFLVDFNQHWPTDEDAVSVESVRKGLYGHGQARSGNASWRRLAEKRSGSAKSVFHFDVPGSVAKSTHSGLPWLLYLRRKLGDRIFFWPYEGWDIPRGRSVVVEAYPSLWNKNFPREDRTADQHDAYSVAAWMQQADLAGSLAKFFQPSLMPDERDIANIEGWIFGVM